MSNSLKHVSQIIGTSRKLENEGFRLWTDVIDGDEEARRKMQEYNQQDVICNLDLFERILPSDSLHALHRGDRRERRRAAPGAVLPG